MQYTFEQLNLANEIALKLNDRKSLSQFLKYTTVCEHTFLRETLYDVLAKPESEITRSRAALFNHIVRTDARYQSAWN